MIRMNVKTVLCVTALTIALLLNACGKDNTDGNSDSSTTTLATTQVETKTSDVEENTGEKSYSIFFERMYDDDEELVAFVPLNLVGGAYAELMMQVTGYTYEVTLTDDTTYNLTYTYECGTPGEGTSMYMKRILVFSGSYTEDNNELILEKPIHMTFEQESAGQFAADSGEGGADMWGPHGLKFDETYQNENGYSGVGTGAEYLNSMQKCVVKINGSEIQSFESVE